jgi:hypothetical protein
MWGSSIVNWSSKSRCVVKLNHPARSLLGRIHDAGVKRSRVNMQADGALSEMFRIHDTMHRIGGINGARTSRIHFDCVRRCEFTSPVVHILRDKMKILHQQTAARHQHPTILIAMIVHRADLPDFPTNGNQLVQRRLVNQIAGVVLAVPADVGGQSPRCHRRLFKEGKNFTCVIEGGLGELVQLGDELLNGKLPWGGLSGQEVTFHSIKYKALVQQPAAIGT